MSRQVPVALFFIVFVGVLGCQGTGAACAEDSPQRRAAPVSPRGSATQAIVKTIETAHASILVQAYSFTSAPIAKALVEAHTRGVKVNVILDRSNRTAHTPAADLLARAGIPTRIDPTRKIAHSRAMLIVDGEMVITAAFNIFGRAGGERNAEDLVMIRGKAEASVYTGQWREHAQGSVPYTPGQADK